MEEDVGKSHFSRRMRVLVWLPGLVEWRGICPNLSRELFKTLYRRVGLW